MSGLKEVELETTGTKDLALIGNNDAVWLVVPLRWWDLATLVFWLFLPSDRKAWVTLTMHDGKKARFRAVRVASRFVRVRGNVL
jgi:hypothetical protein